MPVKSNNAKLLQASKAGNLKRVRALLAAGADPDAFNRRQQSALMIAAENGHPLVMRELRRNCACLEWFDEDQWTPLMYASLRGHARCVLEMYGVYGNTASWGCETALDFAADGGHWDCVTLLCAHFEDVEFTAMRFEGDIRSTLRILSTEHVDENSLENPTHSWMMDVYDFSQKSQPFLGTDVSADETREASKQFKKDPDAFHAAAANSTPVDAESIAAVSALKSPAMECMVHARGVRAAGNTIKHAVKASTASPKGIVASVRVNLFESVLSYSAPTKIFLHVELEYAHLLPGLLRR